MLEKIQKILNENFSEIAFAATQSLSAWLQWNAIKCEITFEAGATIIRVIDDEKLRDVQASRGRFKILHAALAAVIKKAKSFKKCLKAERSIKSALLMQIRTTSHSPFANFHFSSSHHSGDVKVLLCFCCCNPIRFHV
jgi:hypothetical protein